jgi:hypothetical protein
VVRGVKKVDTDDVVLISTLAVNREDGVSAVSTTQHGTAQQRKIG